VPFCGPNTVDHFLCDLAPLLALSCAPVSGIRLICGIVSSLIIFLTLLYILGTYCYVLSVVLQMSSGSGRQKAFSTCASHLAVISLFYGSVMVMYVSPGSGEYPGIQKFVTLFYALATPFFNPLIYNFRNKDMEEVELEQAASVGDALGLGDDVGQHFGHIGTDIADLQEGEVGQEDVHGCMELPA